MHLLFASAVLRNHNSSHKITLFERRDCSNHKFIRLHIAYIIDIVVVREDIITYRSTQIWTNILFFRHFQRYSSVSRLKYIDFVIHCGINCCSKHCTIHGCRFFAVEYLFRRTESARCQTVLHSFKRLSVLNKIQYHLHPLHTRQSSSESYLVHKPADLFYMQ